MQKGSRMYKPTIIRALTLEASVGAVLSLTVPASASRRPTAASASDAGGATIHPGALRPADLVPRHEGALRPTSKDHAIGRITTPINSHYFGVPTCS